MKARRWKAWAVFTDAGELIVACDAWLLPLRYRKRHCIRVEVREIVKRRKK